VPLDPSRDAQRLTDCPPARPAHAPAPTRAPSAPSSRLTAIHSLLHSRARTPHAAYHRFCSLRHVDSKSQGIEGRATATPRSKVTPKYSNVTLSHRLSGHGRSSDPQGRISRAASRAPRALEGGGCSGPKAPWRPVAAAWSARRDREPGEGRACAWGRALCGGACCVHSPRLTGGRRQSPEANVHVRVRAPLACGGGGGGFA
jgi:hypothetical protein